MTFTPREEAAVEAACAAVRAAEATDGQFRGARPDEVLSARLDGLDWSIDGRGFELLREVARRQGLAISDPSGESAELPWKAGARYEARYDPARRHLSRAL